MTNDGGRTWSSSKLPVALLGLAVPLLGQTRIVCALACPSASSCVAVADGYSPPATYVTRDGGKTWTTDRMPTDFVPHDLQCSSPTNCVVTGFYQSPGGGQTTPEGTVLYTTDGGTTWKTASLPSGLGSLGTVSCATATVCLATFFAADGQGSQVPASTDGGASWSLFQHPACLRELYSAPHARRQLSAGQPVSLMRKFLLRL